MNIPDLRRAYHQRICREIVLIQTDGESGCPNFAARGSKASRAIAQGIVRRLGVMSNNTGLSGQTAGGLFEAITRDFLEKAFTLLHHLRPGMWEYSTQTPISHFDQYDHLANLERIVEQYNELASSLGTDYIIKPDIVIGRRAVAEDEINQEHPILAENATLARLTPLRQANSNSRGSFCVPASVVNGRSEATGAKMHGRKPSI